MKAIRGAITEDGGVITATQVNKMLALVQHVSDAEVVGQVEPYEVLRDLAEEAQELKRELTRKRR